MIRLLISVALALAVATSAEAMSPAPLHEPDGMITKVRKARQPACWDPNQIRINGSARIMPAMSPEPNTCVFHGMKAFELSTMGRWRLAALTFGVRAGHTGWLHKLSTVQPSSHQLRYGGC